MPGSGDAAVGVAPPPAGVVGRCTHLSEVCRQVWPKYAGLLWMQRGSNSENGGFIEMWKNQVRAVSAVQRAGFQEPSCRLWCLQVSVIGCVLLPEQWGPWLWAQLVQRGRAYLGPNL